MAKALSLGSGNSSATMKSPESIVKIWMTGALTMSVMKIAALGEGLDGAYELEQWRGQSRGQDVLQSARVT